MPAVRFVELPDGGVRAFVVPPRDWLVRGVLLSLLVLGVAVPFAPVWAKILSPLPLAVVLFVRFHVSVDRGRGVLRQGIALGSFPLSATEELVGPLRLELRREKIAAGREEISVDLSGPGERERRILETADRAEAEALVRALEPISDGRSINPRGSSPVPPRS